MADEQSENTETEDGFSSENNEVEILELAREEAHRTVDKQIETLEDIDNKAAWPCLDTRNLAVEYFSPD